jgi:hypothetical protein
MADSICAQCNLPNDPVTVENGVSVPDVNGNVVMLHNACLAAWLAMQVKNEE